MISPRERILKILRGEKPDQVPWFGDLAYWAYARIRRGEVPENFYTSPAYYDWHRELKVGFYLQGYEPYRPVYDGVKVTSWEEGHSRFTRMETPQGTLQECWEYIPDSYTIGPREHLVKSPADLPALRYLYEHVHYEPLYEEAARRYELAGDQGLVLCYLPKSPLMNLVALQAGIDAVVGLMMDAPEEFEATLEVMEKSLEAACELAVKSPAECLMIPENLSSEVVGKRMFEKYMRRYQEKWVGRIADAGKFSFIHIDGTLRGLLREEASVGFTVLEALTPEPCGDVSIHDFASLANNDKTILWGGMPGVYFTDLVSDGEFERHTREVLEVMRSAPRYVLGVADQVPPDVNPKRVRQVAELVEKYGRYE